MPVKSKNIKKSSSVWSKIRLGSRKSRLLILLISFGVVGAVAVYKSFALTEPMKVTASWEYNLANSHLIPYVNPNRSCGSSNVKTIPEEAKNGVLVVSAACGTNNPDGAGAYTGAARLDGWASGKYYRTCAWVKKDTNQYSSSLHSGGAYYSQLSIKMNSHANTKIWTASNIDVMFPNNGYEKRCGLWVQSSGNEGQLGLFVLNTSTASFRVQSIILEQGEKKTTTAPTPAPASW